jgi:hypothetical protein
MQRNPNKKNYFLGLPEIQTKKIFVLSAKSRNS